MFGHLDRQTAARYSAFALAPMVLGLVGAALAFRSGGVDYEERIRGLSASKSDGVKAPTKPVRDTPAAAPQPDASSIAARFDAIKNRPTPLIETPTTDIGAEAPPPTTAGSDITYIGPINLGPTMLAILRVEGKQMTVSKGRTIHFSVDEESRSAKIIEIDDHEVTVEEHGAERKIARADHGGEVVSYLGGKPARKPVAMKSKSSAGANAPGGGMQDAKARADHEAKTARVMQELQPLLDMAAKATDESQAQRFREKAIMQAKREGVDPGIIEGLIKRADRKGEEQ